MKKILFFFALLAMTTTSIAQTRTVNGAVIDKNGNPLPGAKVEAIDGVYTTVNADGSFSLDVPSGVNKLTFSYVGLGEKSMRISDAPMLIELRKASHWFANVEADVIFNDKEAMSFGVRAGFLNKWGAYVRVVVPSFSNYDQDTHVPTATLGFIGRIYNDLYLYGGAGYTKVLSEDNYRYEDNEEDGMAFDAGFMYKAGHFNVTLGYGHHTDFDGCNNSCMQFGVGYNF